MKVSFIQKIGILIGKIIAPFYLVVSGANKMNNLNNIIAGALLIALLPLPYFYYQLLRIVVTVVASIYAYKFYEDNQMPNAITFGVIVLVWNPIFPIFMDKSVWLILDIIGAVIFYFGSPES